MSGEALSNLIDSAHRRRERFHTVELVKLPELRTLQEPTILGTYSFVKQISQTRLLKAPDCVRLDDCIESPSAVARDFLSWKYHKGPRVKHTQIQRLRAGIVSPPGFSEPCTFDHGFYIDIRATYWNIMQTISWKADYWPGKWLGRQAEPPVDFPFPEHKISRNCLVSAGLSHGIQRYDPTSAKLPEPIFPGNPLSNLSLYRLICDILNSIGADAIAAGAVYVNNDGYIATNAKSAREICQIILDWGLSPRVKWEGPGWVHALGSYKVGEHKSRRELKTHKSKKIQKPIGASWLQKRVAKFAANRERRESDRKESKAPGSPEKGSAPSQRDHVRPIFLRPDHLLGTIREEETCPTVPRNRQDQHRGSSLSGRTFIRPRLTSMSLRSAIRANSPPRSRYSRQ
jgi:hypothetical protein